MADWDPTKPADTGAVLDQLDGTRKNFADLDTAISVDHYGMGVTDQGKHNQLTLPGRTTLTRSDSTGFLYTKSTGVNDTELYFLDSAASANEVQLTNAGKVDYGNLMPIAWAYVSGIAIINGVNLSVAASTSDSVTFNISGYTPSGTDYGVIFTPVSLLSTTLYSIQILSAAQFKITTNQGGLGVHIAYTITLFDA